MPISAADALANTAASARKSEAAAVASVQIPPLPAPTAGAPALRATPAMVEVATLDDMTVTARVEPTASSEDAVSRERSFASAISAASTSANARALSPRDSATEKNSLTARESSVTVPPSEAGIGVAHASNVMTDTALPSPISAVAPAWRGEAMEAQVASSANAKDDVPSLAHRAVETVVAVVDAQAASRLQPTPGVSLRFRVGEEDLAVRIELRGGEVHTEFRTDSPDLRVALQHEWRALASRPDAAVRLSEPVFTNAGSGANHDSSSSLPFSQQHGQSTAQQQHQQQQHAALREAPEIFGRVGRRFSATTTEEAPAPVAPPASVSSRRLSAVA